MVFSRKESESDEFFSEPSATYVHRRSWTTPEKMKARGLCDFTTFKLPSIEVCQKHISSNEELQTRTPNQLKAWVSNEHEKVKKTNNVTTKKQCE